MRLYKFGAEWCGPCKMMKPVFDRLSDDPDLTAVQFRDIDVDDGSDDTLALIKNYSVRNIPTFVLTDDDGHIIARVSKAMPESEFKKWILENS